jgi:hypothetical protein
MMFAFGGALSTTGSFFVSTICFFLLTWISVYLLLGKRYVVFYLFTFSFLIVISVIHYIGLVDSTYFSSDGGPSNNFWREYLAVYDNLDRVVADRHNNGFLYFDSDSWTVSHPEIWRILTWPTTFLGHKWLNYTPLNAFSSILMSTNLMVWYHHRYDEGNKSNENVKKYVLFFSAFFPQFVLCDTVWRDPFGIALISIGLILLSLSNSVLKKSLSFCIFAAFSFIQRTVYMLISGVSLALGELTNKKNAIRMFLIPMFVILMIVLVNIFNTNVNEEYASGYVGQTSVLSLPLKIVFGLIGPFPWTQFIIIREFNASFNFQLRDYVTGVFQIGYLYAIIANWRSISFNNLDYMTIMGFGIALSGIATTMMHIGYISEGLYFTLPWFFSQVGSKFNKYFLLSFISLVILNILTIILGTSGITSFFR